MSETPPTGDANTTGVRVLAFTCSRYRPLMARHCVMQMQRQTYKVDHALYLNTSEDDPPGHTVINYDPLFEDAREPGGGRLIIGRGRSKPYHGNYVACLGLVDLDDYDLFLKIDDDDFYFRRYAEDVVADFVARRWDYSGTHSHGVVNGRHWFPDWMHTDLGFEFVDLELKVPSLMPPTLAMSRRAMKVILGLTDDKQIEDVQWRRLVAKTPELVMAERTDGNFVYHIHGGNASTGTLLMP